MKNLRKRNYYFVFTDFFYDWSDYPLGGIKGTFYRLQVGSCYSLPRTGDVDADEAFAGLAVHRAAVD